MVGFSVEEIFTLNFRANIGEDGDVGAQLMNNYIAGHTNLERFTGRYIRYRKLSFSP